MRVLLLQGGLEPEQLSRGTARDARRRVQQDRSGLAPNRRSHLADDSALAQKGAGTIIRDRMNTSTDLSPPPYVAYVGSDSSQRSLASRARSVSTAFIQLAHLVTRALSWLASIAAAASALRSRWSASVPCRAESGS